MDPNASNSRPAAPDNGVGFGALLGIAWDATKLHFDIALRKESAHWLVWLFFLLTLPMVPATFAGYFFGELLWRIDCTRR